MKRVLALKSSATVPIHAIALARNTLPMVDCIYVTIKVVCLFATFCREASINIQQKLQDAMVLAKLSIQF